MKLFDCSTLNIQSNRVSVIIPSKDNPRLLNTCITSFLERTKIPCYVEFVVVDNGSVEFKDAINYVPILVLAIIFFTLASFLGTIYTAYKKSKTKINQE